MPRTPLIGCSSPAQALHAGSGMWACSTCLSVCLFLLSILLTACERHSVEHRETLFAFGTLVDITIFDERPQRATEAIGMVGREFQRMHNDWHAWKPGGELTTLNERMALGQAATVSVLLLPLLEQSKQLYRQSDGLFNPAIGALIELWGFHSDDPPAGPPPEQKQIEKLLKQAPGMDALIIEGNRVRSRNRAVQLDLGGFAKGYALNEAIGILRAQGIKNAIVNAGGDLCVAGRHADRPWRIGIRHPQGPGILASVEVNDDECVLTSGNYERYREYQGKRYAHIIDPRSGWPVDHVTSATVIHTDGGVADAAATALTVAGTQDWQHVARRMELKYVMVVDEAGKVYMSPSMAGRVVFEGEPPADIIVGDPL